MQQDFRATGTSIGEHPASIVKRLHWCFPVPKESLTLAKQLLTGRDGQTVHSFGMVLVRQAPSSAKGMVFFTLEDETGYINLVFTPQIYEKFHQVINAQGFLCVAGKLQRQSQSHSLLVRSVYRPSFNKAEVLPMRRAKKSRQVVELEFKSRNYM